MASITTVFTAAATGAFEGSYGHPGGGPVLESWGTLANCLSSNDQRSNYSAGGLVSPYPDGYSIYLIATDLASAIPAGATIDGIEITVERRGNCTVGKWCDKTVSLYTGAVSGDNKAVLTSWGNTSDSTATYGGSADLWGLSLDAATLNASSFGVALSVQASGLDMEDGNPEVDAFGITVYYTEAATPPEYTLTDYQGRNDDGGEVSASSKAAVNTAWDQIIGETFRVRSLITTTGSGETRTFPHEANVDGAGWFEVTRTTDLVRRSNSTAGVEGADCTQILSVSDPDDVWINDNNGVKTLGVVEVTTDIPSGMRDLELDAAFCLVPGINPGATVQIRPMNLDTYDNTPTLTVQVPGGTPPLPNRDTDCVRNKTVVGRKADQNRGKVN